jgi:hypothetical protein
MVTFLVTAANYLWNLFSLWLHSIFVLPFQNTDMLWLLVPIWLTWFFAEFFQEKTGTSFGNAITNSVVVLWGSIDCTRQTLKLIANHTITNTMNISLRFALIGLIFIYGIIILIWAWKTKELIKYFGRIREVTYVFIIFVPMFYNAVDLSWELLIGAVLFFPLFYWIIEFIDRHTPNSTLLEQDLTDAANIPPDFIGKKPLPAKKLQQPIKPSQQQYSQPVSRTQRTNQPPASSRDSSGKQYNPWMPGYKGLK